MECQHGYEASVHLLAKEVFKETKTLCLPGFTLRRECKNGNERILIHNSRRSQKSDCEIFDPELVEWMSLVTMDTSYYTIRRSSSKKTTFSNLWPKSVYGALLCKMFLKPKSTT